MLKIVFKAIKKRFSLFFFLRKAWKWQKSATKWIKNDQKYLNNDLKWQRNDQKTDGIRNFLQFFDEQTKNVETIDIKKQHEPENNWKIHRLPLEIQLNQCKWIRISWEINANS